MSDSRNIALRLAVLAFVSVLVQIAGIAQIRVFGVAFDLAPLVVAAAGFLTGALSGALFGFGVLGAPPTIFHVASGGVRTGPHRQFHWSPRRCLASACASTTAARRA